MWVQIFNNVGNIFQEEELDEVEMQFAEIVYFDKLKKSVELFSQNMLLSLLFSFSRLNMEEYVIFEIMEHINVNQLNNFQNYLFNICLQLNKMEEKYPICEQKIEEIENYMKSSIE